MSVLTHKTIQLPFRLAAISILLTLVFLLRPLTAQDITVQLPEQARITAEQAVQLAVANNPDIKRALLSIENADEQVRIAWSEVLPTVSSSATYTRNIEIPVNFVPAQVFDPNAPAGELIPLQFGTDNNWQGGVTVSQNIFRGEAIVGISSSSLFKSAQEESLRNVAQQVITAARKGFHAVLIAKEQLRLQKAVIDRLRSNLRENRARLREGLIEEYDVLRLEVQLANEEPQLKDAELGVQEAYRSLNEIMGLPVDTPLEAVGSLSSFNLLRNGDSQNENESLYRLTAATPLPDLERQEVIDMMRNQRGDLRVLDVQNDLKDREILAIKSRFLPTISADYNLQWTAAQPGTPRPFENSVRFQTLVLNVSLPLFTGFERRANLNIAQIEKRDIEVQTWASEKTAMNEYETTSDRLTNLRETADSRQFAVEEAKRGLEIALRRYENGVGSQLEVTEAELQVREAELNYASLVADYLNTKADFDLALGLVPMIDETDYEF
ncbi:TolC family protein [Rhodohalobacter mucosus]|nr:TolC family protein [Rhodohalobacter mucosus]